LRYSLAKQSQGFKLSFDMSDRTFVAMDEINNNNNNNKVANFDKLWALQNLGMTVDNLHSQ
jgi:hypothetical protein